VAKRTELHLQLISTMYYNNQCNLPDGVFAIGFGCHCLKTDGLIIVSSLLAFVAIA
jgi:hypothetical protein